MKTCEICGKSVKKQSRRFCSQACSNAHKSSSPNPITGKVAKTCEVCGKAFLVWGYRAKIARVCSNACRGKLQTNENLLHLICAWCGKEFARRKSRQKFNVRRATENGHIKESLPYCSKSCQNLGLRDLYAPEERSAFVHGKTSIYVPGWNGIRTKILKRDHRACRICGSTFRLSVHHVDHHTENNDSMNLITLCGTCHAKEKWFRFIYEPIIRKLLRSGT